MSDIQITSSGKQAFSKHLKELMEENKDTQSDLAAAIDVQRQSISYYLNGDRNPGADVIKRIAEKYDVSADWLLGLSKDRRREITSADDLGIADTTARFIKELDLFIKEDLDEIIFNHSSALSGLLQELSFVLALSSDLREGKYTTEELVSTIDENSKSASCEILCDHKLLQYKSILLEKQFSDFIREIM